MASSILFCTVLTPNKLCYPRYNNTHRQIKSIERRYAEIEERLDSYTGVEIIVSEPRFVIIEGAVKSEIERALFPYGETSKYLKISFNTIFERITPQDIVFLPSQLSYDLFDMLCRMSDVNFIIVGNKSVEKKDSTERFKGCPNVKVMVLKDVKESASIALEEITFRPMKDIAEKLAHIIETNTETNTKTEFREKIDAHRDTIERLISEISGMYNRNKISEQDNPKISTRLERNVSDKVAQELYEIDLSVKSCGYRFSTLQVFVDDTSNKDINDQIKNVLHSNSILKYEIVPSIDTYKPLVNVGAKCHPDPKSSFYGTVGGFATNSRSDLCALVSRHVAVHSSDGNILLTDNQETVPAQLIQETVTTEGGNNIDISAAIIDIKDATNCNTRFRDEDGNPTKGLDCSYDAKDLYSRNVHIWGASTSPGLGIITMPEIRHRYADNTFIVVEDRPDNDRAFCKGGDSGAMVCADDIDGKGVEVISIVIGEDTEEKGKYATFRLDKGLEQLKRQTSENFNLCKD